MKMIQCNMCGKVIEFVKTDEEGWKTIAVSNVSIKSYAVHDPDLGDFCPECFKRLTIAGNLNTFHPKVI